MVSICCAGIRPGNWPRLEYQIRDSIHPYDFELIFCGPYPPKPDHYVKWIRSYRNPTACVHEAILSSRGDLVCWLSDDGKIIEDSLKIAIDTWYEVNNPKGEIILKYYEGDNTQPGSLATQPEGYWMAWYHGSLRLPGIPSHYMLAPCGLLSKKYFLELGGFDCRFEHINLSCADLSNRIQNDGGQLYSPSKYIMNCEFSHNIVNGRCDCVLCKAYVENDLPYFQSIYGSPDALNRINIPLDNWLETPERWRRFK